MAQSKGRAIGSLTPPRPIESISVTAASHSESAFNNKLQEQGDVLMEPVSAAPIGVAQDRIGANSWLLKPIRGQIVPPRNSSPRRSHSPSNRTGRSDPKAQVNHVVEPSLAQRMGNSENAERTPNVRSDSLLHRLGMDDNRSGSKNDQTGLRNRSNRPRRGSIGDTEHRERDNVGPKDAVAEAYKGRSRRAGRGRRARV